MTYAPATILTARALVQQCTKLPAVSLGIVGDPAHRGGYHCGRDRTVPGDYSVVESSRDSKPTDAAMALDVGWFDITVAGKRHTLRSFSVWLVAQCAAGTPDTADIREVIYSPDGATVRRWDRLGRRSTGDRSHIHHTHLSYHRDSEHRDKAGVFRRYFQAIGVLPAPTPKPPAAPPPSNTPNPGPGGDMPTPKDLLDYDDIPNPYGDKANNPNIQVRTALKAAAHVDVQMNELRGDVRDLNAKIHELFVKLDGISARVDQVATRPAGGIDPAQIAAQIAESLRGRLES